MKKNTLSIIFMTGFLLPIVGVTVIKGSAESLDSKENITKESSNIFSSTQGSNVEFNSSLITESSNIEISPNNEQHTDSNTQIEKEEEEEEEEQKKNKSKSTLTSDEVKQDIVTQIEDLIKNSEYKEIISEFSNNLYDEVPQNDEFAGQKYEITDLENTYNEKIKKNSTSISLLLEEENKFLSYNESDVKKQLILLCYLMRWGTFSDGSEFWKELYLLKSNIMSVEQVKLLKETFIKNFFENPQENLASKNVSKLFEKTYKEIGISWTYKQSLEIYLNKVRNISDYSKWFYSMFPGKIYKDKYKGTVYDVGIWNKGNKFNSYLPYLLTQSKTSNLMIGETRGEIIFTGPRTYDNNQENADIAMSKAMKTITNIIDLYDRTIEDKEQINIDKVLGQRAILDQGRHWLDPNDSLSFELYRVAGYTGSHGNNGGVGGAGQIQMQFSKMDWSPTLAHEFTHELIHLFNTGSEFYSTYVDNVGRQAGAYVNIFADGDLIKHQNNVVANTSVEQLQNKSDLVTYAKNMEDTAYALDAMIGLKVLKLPLEEQIKFIKLACVDGIEGGITSEATTTVQTKDLTIDELKKLNLKTINDLIDNNVVIMQPSDTNKNILENHGQGYGTTLTYSAFFLSNGKPYHHNHRITNTLLAYNGWEAFKKFNDSYVEAEKQFENEGLIGSELVNKASLKALRATYDNNEITYQTIIKEKYKDVIEKLETKGLLDMTSQEFLDNISLEELNNFYELKQRKMEDYLNLSGEFSQSIFGVNNDVMTNVSTYTSLYEAVLENPKGIINIEKDFDVDGIYKDKELPEFSGVLNGKGHKISQNKHSLFKTLTNAEVKNLVLSNSDIYTTEKNVLGGLVDKANDTIVKNVHVIDSKIEASTSSGRPQVGGLVGYGKSIKIYDSSVQNSKLVGGDMGGIIGVVEKSKVINVYTTGELSTQLKDHRIGGIIGNGFNNVTLKNAYTTMKINPGNGILGSEYAYGNREIMVENVISFAEILEDNYKVYFRDPVSNIWENNYEIEEQNGKSSVEFLNLGVSSISKNIISSNFFKTSLDWNKESIWSLTNDVSPENLPYLLNDDPRNPNRDLSQLNLISDHYDAYVGDSVDLKSLIKEVKDKNGNEVSKNEVSIKGKLDTSKTGSTVINYSYNSVEKNITINVKENKTSLIVHDSSINVGDKWTPQSNFDKATDKDGKTVNFSSIEVDKDTIDTGQAKEVKVSYSYGGVTSYAIVSIKGEDNSSENSGDESSKTPEIGSDSIHNSNKDLESGLVAQNDQDIKNEKETNKLPATNEEMSFILSVVGISMLLGIISFLIKKYLSNKN